MGRSFSKKLSTSLRIIINANIINDANTINNVSVRFQEMRSVLTATVVINKGTSLNIFHGSSLTDLNSKHLSYSSKEYWPVHRKRILTLTRVCVLCKNKY